MISPSRSEFRDLARKGNLIPVFGEVVADAETPVSAYYKITRPVKGGPEGRNDPAFRHSFLLESVEGGEKIGRYSFLGVRPRAVFTQRGGKAELVSPTGSETIEGKDVFDRIRVALSRFTPVAVPGLPPFIGGAVGYVSYDVISEVEPTVQRPAPTPVDVPEAVFLITDAILAFDKVRHTIKVISQAYLGEAGVDPDVIYDKATAEIEAIIEKLRMPVSLPAVSLRSPAAELQFSSNKTKAEHREMVLRAKQYILDGDIIQTVLSQRFSIKLPVSPLAVYRALRMVNPSPYMFLLDCDGFAVVGASPEVHARCSERMITVRPIAGTRRRGKSDAEDAELAKELLADPKERAEHIMLVDLARNDIGRIAETGTVKVDELMTVEKYSHVMHIVSNVSGTLKADLGSDAVMRSTFPAGTLSGAPKVRAMQIISELEKEGRGPYGGAVAYYSFSGNVDSCITIRTAVLKVGVAYIQSGGGIVADSVPETEYEETVNKAKAMMKALAMARDFEV